MGKLRARLASVGDKMMVLNPLIDPVPVPMSRFQGIMAFASWPIFDHETWPKLWKVGPFVTILVAIAVLLVPGVIISWIALFDSIPILAHGLFLVGTAIAVAAYVLATIFTGMILSNGAWN